MYSNRLCPLPHVANCLLGGEQQRSPAPTLQASVPARELTEPWWVNCEGPPALAAGAATPQYSSMNQLGLIWSMRLRSTASHLFRPCRWGMGLTV